MNWLLRGARFPGIVIAALVGAALTVGLSGSSAPVPSLTTGELRPVPLAAVAALLPVAAVVLGWSSLPRATRVGAVRSLTWLPHASAALAVSLAGLVAFSLGDAAIGVGAARDVAGLCALAAIAGCWAGVSAAATAGPAFLLLAFLCGQADGPGQTYWWAWILRPAADPTAAVVVGAGVVAAARLLARRADRLRDPASG